MKFSPGNDARPSIERETILEVDGLARSFGATPVVKRFDATLGQGRRLGLHGPTGSGKSTLLRCLSGTLSPTSGTAQVMRFDSGTFEARSLTGSSLAQERSF